MSYDPEINALLGIVASLSPFFDRNVVPHFKIVLLVARERSCTSRYLQDALNVDQSTISRKTLELGPGRIRDGKRKGGKGWVESYRISGSKAYRYRLTPKGEDLIRKVIRNMRKPAIERLMT